MVMKEGYNIQSVYIAKTGIPSAKPKVIPFMGEIEYEKYPKAVWNFMSR